MKMDETRDTESTGGVVCTAKTKSMYRDEYGVLHECAGIACPMVPGHHKAWAVDVTWTDEEAFDG